MNIYELESVEEDRNQGATIDLQGAHVSAHNLCGGKMNEVPRFCSERPVL
jgi:hypothetical protein